MINTLTALGSWPPDPIFPGIKVDDRDTSGVITLRTSILLARPRAHGCAITDINPQHSREIHN